MADTALGEEDPLLSQHKPAPSAETERERLIIEMFLEHLLLVMLAAVAKTPAPARPELSE